MKMKMMMMTIDDNNNNNNNNNNNDKNYSLCVSALTFWSCHTTEKNQRSEIMSTGLATNWVETV